MRAPPAVEAGSRELRDRLAAASRATVVAEPKLHGLGQLWRSTPLGDELTRDRQHCTPHPHLRSNRECNQCRNVIALELMDYPCKPMDDMEHVELTLADGKR